jgi:catalase
MKPQASIVLLGALAIAGLLLLQNFLHQNPSQAAPPDNNDLAQQIFDTMIQVHGVTPGYRPVHAKGIVCHGTFKPTPDAANLSKAAHFSADSVPITVRFSDGASDPTLPDAAPNSGPRGIAIRFKLPSGDQTDIVAMSHNGFVVANGDDFLALQKAIVATDTTKPHPWPIEAFLGAHPAALKFVQESGIAPVSFATESFFSNDAFIFTNKAAAKQPARYQIIPAAGKHDLTPDEAKKPLSDNYLFDDLKTRVASAPVVFELKAQLPNPTDPTNDPTQVWPDDRKTIDLGTITITTIDPNSDVAQKALAFDPTNLTDGIDLSDDPIPALRSQVYALSVQYRNK